MNRVYLLVMFFIFTLSCLAQNDLDRKINKLLSELTLEEKIRMIHASSNFTNGAVPRLGIPAFEMSDGPCGIRYEFHLHDWGFANWKNDDATYFPSPSALASTWNLNLAMKFGQAIGQEAKVRGKSILLAPGINIVRTPLNGRNWEYLSEDPFFVSKFVVPIVKGIQSNGVASCVKHYILNNQEENNDSVDVYIDERALREIYLPGFKAAVKKGGALAVMGSYNKVRGQHAAYNKYLTCDILKKEWGFKGIFISDWGATHNTVEAAKYGLDIEMGTDKKNTDDYYMAKPLLSAVRNGKISENYIDDKVRRILYVMFKLNMINQSPFDTTGMYAKIATPERIAVAKEIADEAIVLLKNSDNFLPLDISKIKSIAVIGDNATRKHSMGGLSAGVKARYEITPLEALKEKLKDRVQINYATGYKAPVILFGEDTTLDKVDTTLINDAVRVARKSDYVIIFGGLNHNMRNDCEGFDRLSMDLPYGQDILISKVLGANPKTLLVLLCGTPVEMGSWYNKLPALMQNSYLGMEAGNALTGTIFGDINPSGKLPVTYPKKLSDSPAHSMGEYPGKNDKEQYKENIFVGYRYFDAKNIEPMFPFGFGLSYTRFKYSDLEIPAEVHLDSSEFTVSFFVKNIGNREGDEITELYIQDGIDSIIWPYKELKGFTKVSLKAGENKKVNIKINLSDLQHFNDKTDNWYLKPEKLKILVGSSSKDIRLTGETTLK